MQQVARKEEIMVRNMDLIRDLLLAFEADQRLDLFAYVTPDETDNFGVIGKGKYSEEEVRYAIAQLIGEGFVKGKLERPPLMHMICGLTWAGHDFTDLIHDTTLWEKIKTQAIALGLHSIKMLAELAFIEARKKLGIS